MLPTKKLAVIAMLVAQATVLHFIEGLLPNPLPFPGVKLGLANIITLFALITIDFRTALEISVLRTILGSLLSGTLLGIGFFMSFSGAVTATIIMAILLKLTPGLSLIVVSVIGAVAHNIAQLAIAALILKFSGIMLYLPVMLLVSIPTGVITGLLVQELVDYIKSTSRENMFR